MPRQRRRAFSLVELLTVIGIIAILIALLMPAMVRARAHAKSLVCQSNLRQIAQAAIARSIEHHGYVQVAGLTNGVDFVSPQSLEDSEEKRYLWYDDQGERKPAPLQAALAPYLGVRNVRLDSADNLLADLEQVVLRTIFTCPAQTEIQPGIMIAGGTWRAPDLRTSYAYNEGVFGFESFSTHRLRGQLIKASPPSEIILFTDAVP